MIILYSCSYFINNTAKNDNTFNYNCNLLVKFYDQNLYGDCYIYKNENGFFLDMYTFGNLVFRLHEMGEKIKLFIQNSEYEYSSSEDMFFSLNFMRFKDILLSFLQNEKYVYEQNKDYKIITFNEEYTRKLVFKDIKNENYIEFIVKK